VRYHLCIRRNYLSLSFLIHPLFLWLPGYMTLIFSLFITISNTSKTSTIFSILFSISVQHKQRRPSHYRRFYCWKYSHRQPQSQPQSQSQRLYSSSIHNKIILSNHSTIVSIPLIISNPETKARRRRSRRLTNTGNKDRRHDHHHQYQYRGPYRQGKHQNHFHC